MVDEKKELAKRKERLKSWLSNNYNLSLVFIILAAFAIRLYYFVHTSGQTLWWDESEYMSAAKHWAFGVNYDLNPQRPPLFQFLSALVFMVGLGEGFIRFAFVLIPSLIFIIAVFYLGKEMYNEKVGLLSSFFVCVSWTVLFWTARVQPDSFSILFQTLAILFMWRYWKENDNKSIIYAGIFAAIGFYFKVSALLVPIIFLVFIIFKDRLSMFKNKQYYKFVGTYLLTLVPYFVWAYSTFGTPFAFRQGYSDAVGTIVPFSWSTLNLFYGLTDNLLFILFLAGLILSLEFLLYFDIVVKNREKMLNPGIFGVLTLIIVSAFYIFYIRGGTEDRWVFLWLPFIFMMASLALVKIYELTGKYGKNIAIIVVLVLLALSGYFQLTHANQIINDRKDSYSPIKDAGLWIKINSDFNDKVATISIPQTTYYSEREIVSYSKVKNSSDFDLFLDENRPRFVEMSLFEPHPSTAIARGQQEDKGYIVMPYFNSSIVFDSTGKLISADVKQTISKNNKEFKYVYPIDSLNGVFVYEVKYLQ